MDHANSPEARVIETAAETLAARDVDSGPGKVGPLEQDTAGFLIHETFERGIARHYSRMPPRIGRGLIFFQ